MIKLSVVISSLQTRVAEPTPALDLDPDPSLGLKNGLGLNDKVLSPNRTVLRIRLLVWMRIRILLMLLMEIRI